MLIYELRTLTRLHVETNVKLRISLTMTKAFKQTYRIFVCFLFKTFPNHLEGFKRFCFLLGFITPAV